MIICITGMPGSGKTTAAAMLKSKGFRVIEMSDFARALMRKKRMDINVKSLAEFINGLKKESGMDILAKLTAEKIPRNRNTVINGVRNMAEIRYLRKRFGTSLLIIAIIAPPKMRYKRLSVRSSRSPESYEDFLWREKDERFKGTGKVVESADIMVANVGSKAELKSDTARVIKIAAVQIKRSRSARKP